MGIKGSFTFIKLFFFINLNLFYRYFCTGRDFRDTLHNDNKDFDSLSDIRSNE